jgi:hypothetical protein
MGIAIFYCLTTPLEYFFHLDIFGWTKLIIATPLLIILAFYTKWAKGNTLRKAIIVLVGIVIIYSRDISERAFLGKQIANNYLGEDAGFVELYLFDSGKAKIIYGGIFGSEYHYGTFKTMNDSVLVDTKANLSNLTNLSITLYNKKFKIGRL